MKQKQLHQPDLLPIFRLFAILWLGLMIFLLLLGLSNGSPIEILKRDWFFVISAAILVIYLYTPRLEARLGRFYLPLGLAIIAVLPSLATYLPLADLALATYDIQTIMMVLIRQLLIWIMTAVMLGWAYNLSTVLVFSIGMGLLNFIIPWLVGSLNKEFMVNYGTFMFVITAAMLLVGYMVSLLSSAERRQRQELETANAQLVQYANTLENLTISRERNRMARDLHDTLAHTLSGLAVQLETTRAVIDKDVPTAKQLLDQSLTTTRSGLKETRIALQALRATPLEDLGLRMALIQLAETEAQRIRAVLDMEITDKLPPLAPEVEQAIYRTAQEAITNVIKHATAKTLTVKLYNGDAIILIVQDDGVGFNVGVTAEKGHYGLVGMKERAAMINGNVDVSSEPGKGTTVQLTIPFANGGRR